MRLLKLEANGEFSFTNNISNPTTRYAILSHTWGEDNEEVTFEDLKNSSGKMKKGYKKLQFCGQQAARDTLEYFWVDTCCIDKSSSAELQEAINSMFRWYKNAEFYAKDWSLLGDKKNDAGYIADATGINIAILENGDLLSDVSVAQRMSWAAKRKCTRLEDVAYSLMGLFGISMPMLYGEGNKAFCRLQEEIIKSSNDLTIFAWNPDPAGVDKYCSILAPCPAVFSESGGIKKFNRAFSHPEFTLNNKGLRMTTSLWKCLVNQMGVTTIRYFLRLGGDPLEPTGAFLIMVGPGYFFRDGHMPFSTASKSMAAGMRTTEIYIAIHPPTLTESIDLTSFSQISFVVPSNRRYWAPTVAIPEELWDDSNGLFFATANHIIQVLKLQLHIPNTNVTLSVVVLYDHRDKPGASNIFNPEPGKRYDRLTRYLFRPRHANERFRIRDLLYEFPEVEDLTDHFEVIVSKERYTIKAIMQLGVVKEVSPTMPVYSLTFEVSKEQNESLAKGLSLPTRK
ncbi:heterokaryon incompatibility protein-domain-containing protein [Bisporella sp. PMI_857]|nr:heterokaryon incompatibility protein-domain-containing protein [Bisporella sp. PMI_857]